MTRYCVHCGSELKEDADVCLKCGKIVGNNNFSYSLNNPEGSKSKVAAALLAFFLGGLGIHNFYLGYTGKGVAQLLLTIIGWVILIGPIIAGIWALVEFILILTGSINDANGNKLI